MPLLEVEDRPIPLATAPATEGPDMRPADGFRAFVRRHRLGSYLFCAYFVSWTGVLIAAAAAGFEFKGDATAIPVLLGMLPGPTVAALAVTALADGRGGLHHLRVRLTRWRVAARWYLLALAMPLVTFGVLSLLAAFADDAYAPSFNIAFILIGTAAGSFEEIGWTGVATPELLRRHRPLMAGLMLGVVWAGWHVLADGITNEPTWWASWWLPRFATVFIVGLIAWRVVMTYVYRHTNSVLVGIVLHGFYTGSLGAFDPETSDGQYVIWTGLMALVLCVVVAAFVAAMRKKEAG